MRLPSACLEARILNEKHTIPFASPRCHAPRPTHPEDAIPSGLAGVERLSQQSTAVVPPGLALLLTTALPTLSTNPKASTSLRIASGSIVSGAPGTPPATVSLSGDSETRRPFSLASARSSSKHALRRALGGSARYMYR